MFVTAQLKNKRKRAKKEKEQDVLLFSNRDSKNHIVGIEKSGDEKSFFLFFVLFFGRTNKTQAYPEKAWENDKHRKWKVK